MLAVRREVCRIGLPSAGAAEATLAIAMGSPENLERRAQESMVCLCPPACVLPRAALHLARSASLSPGESLGTWPLQGLGFSPEEDGRAEILPASKGWPWSPGENGCQGPGRQPAEPGGGCHSDAGLTPRAGARQWRWQTWPGPAFRRESFPESLEEWLRGERQRPSELRLSL